MDHTSSRVRGAFDIRVWNEQGTTTVGKGLFRMVSTVHGTGSGKVKKKKLHVREIGVRAATPEVEELIEKIAARVACRRGVLFSRTRSIKDSPFWLNAVKQGDARIAYSQGRDDLFNLYVADDACELGRRELKRDPKIVGRFFDPGPKEGAFAMEPAQLWRAKCRTRRISGDRALRICRKKGKSMKNLNAEYDWSGFDVSVFDWPKNQSLPDPVPVGEGLFTEYADQVWTEGVRAKDRDVQLDIELLAARLACGFKKELVSSNDPESSYFWRSKMLEGRTGKQTIKRKKLSVEETCRGIPLYTKQGVLQRARRRPKIY